MNRSAARRLKVSAIRLESQPYDFIPKRRAPRLGGPTGVQFCSPSAGINSGSHITGQTLYVRTNGTTMNTNLNATIYNNYGAAIVATKVISVSPNPDGTYSVIAQSCT